MLVKPVYTALMLIFLWMGNFISTCYATKDPSGIEEKALYLMLNYYFEGENMINIAALQSAYHGSATLTYVDAHQPQAQTVDVGVYLGNLITSGKKAMYRKLEVVQMDITGNAAMVHTKISFPDQNKRIHDFLSCLQIEGKWKIINRLSYKEYATFKHSQDYKLKQQDLREIEKTLGYYFQGGDLSDTDAFAQAFHPQAWLAQIDTRSKGLKTQTYQEFVNQYEKRSGQKFKRYHEIHFIKVEGNVAIAKVEITFKTYKAHLTDYVSMVKVGEKWQIIRKVSHQDKLRLMSSLY